MPDTPKPNFLNLKSHLQMIYCLKYFFLFWTNYFLIYTEIW